MPLLGPMIRGCRSFGGKCRVGARAEIVGGVGATRSGFVPPWLQLVSNSRVINITESPQTIEFQ